MASEKKSVVSATVLNEKLTQLEKKTKQLEDDFDDLLCRASKVKDWVDKHQDKISKEKRAVGLMTTLMDHTDHRSEKLREYIYKFYVEMIYTLSKEGLKVSVVEDIIYGIEDKEFAATFEKTMTDLGLQPKFKDDLIMVLDMTRQRENPGKMGDQLNIPPAPPNSPNTREQSLAEMTSYIYVSEELDEQMKEILQKMVEIAVKS